MTTFPRIGITWLATRIVAVASIALMPRLLDDIDIYRGWLPALHAESFPIDDPKWQYPPGAGAIMLAPDFLHIDYAVAFSAMSIAFDLAIMIGLLVAHSRRSDTATRGLWIWAVAGVVVGPIMFTRFDVMPTFFAVAAVLLIARPALSGAAAAGGFLLKLWPALMLLALPRRRTWVGVLWFVMATAAFLVLLTVPFDGSLSFLGNQRARGLQVESTGALPYWLFAEVGGRVASGLDYGSMQIDMAGAEVTGTALSLLGIAMLALIGWWRLNGRLDRVPAGDVALSLVLVMVATSRVYSPSSSIRCCRRTSWTARSGSSSSRLHASWAC